jgi:hypothetical protein
LAEEATVGEGWHSIASLVEPRIESQMDICVMAVYLDTFKQANEILLILCGSTATDVPLYVIDAYKDMSRLDFLQYSQPMLDFDAS